jgi:predicted RNA-binding Zn ribbon-like protein
MPITSPRPLDHLLAVANSYHEPEARDVGSAEGAHWIPAHDHLESSEAAAEFLARMGIRLDIAPTRSQLDRLRLVREAARALLTGPATYQRRLGSLLETVVYRLDSHGRLKAAGDQWDRLIADLLVSLIELGDRSDRLKMCANDQCHWLFLDESKNHSRQWCGSATCGNRERVRRFRIRHEVR